MSDCGAIKLMLTEGFGQRYIRQAVTFEDDRILLVEVKHIHLALRSLLSKQFLLDLREVIAGLLLARKFEHHLERV